MRDTGTVLWFDGARGYGFLTSEGIPDVFCLRCAIRGNRDGSLIDGETVEFGVAERPWARQAEDVIRVSRPADDLPNQRRLGF